MEIKDFYPTKIIVDQTSIDGRGFGVFTMNSIPKDKWLGVYIIDKSIKNKSFNFTITFAGNNTTLFYETIPFGRYMNHSDNPNCDIVFDSEIFYIRSNTDIQRGDELMVDYSIIYNHYKSKGLPVSIKFSFTYQKPDNLSNLF